MAASKRFAIGLIGITSTDSQILKRIFQISTYRPRLYVLVESEPDIDSRADIFILNADDRGAMHNWHARASMTDRPGAKPVIFAGRHASNGSDDNVQLGLPFRATHVLATLDKITVSRMNYIPELTISEDAQDFSEGIVKDVESKKSVGTQRYNAMVVDDSPPVRKKIAIELRMLGVNVDVAECGEQALQMIRQPKKFDIIFLDVMMPGVDGYRVCKAIKKDIRRKHTPVVMLTGRSSRFDKVKGSLAGCDTYLTKPVQHEEFQAVAKRYLAGSE